MTNSVEFVQYETLDDGRIARIWLNRPTLPPDVPDWKSARPTQVIGPDTL